ncbi:amino acid adenylation domain-containing protein [Streptomyces sp. bgisy091]|uniref:amino acid adenylation domain-containing protein n=1 Tax=Streptomyces sp. bgisy091 TaxID=3413778 RepID=UPI003D74235B
MGRPCAAPDEGLHETFARRARARPGATALIDGPRSLTYGELDRTADAWAARLAAAGAGPGDLIPVLLPRGAHLVLALLAVLKTGAAYALLDPAWPEQRLGDIRAQLDPPLAVVEHGSALRLGAAPLRSWSPPQDLVAEPAPARFRAARSRGSDPACVFFTSGTTGSPKGAVTAHRATARLFPADGFASFTADTVMPLAAAVSWDAFSLELWSVLLNGGTSLVVDEPYLSPTALRSGVQRHGVDTVWLTSSLFNMVVDEDPDAFQGLRQVLIGGERLSVPHVRRFLHTHPGTALINGYGPVESTVFTTTHRITAADCDSSGGIPLGRPVPGTQAHVLEPGGDRPCAVGETGELCVAGTGLALGYLGDEALTEERFVRVPLGPGDGATRVYRTGDLVEWGPDGLLRYRGRADRQVKIRGHRVEPAEVERQVVDVLADVRSCRVLARPDSSGTSLELIAFCVLPEEVTDAGPAAARERRSPSALLATLRAALVPYQRPAHLVVVDRFPTTERGKLDERALMELAPDSVRSPDGADADRTTSAPVPADSVTRAVIETFTAVLGCEAVPLDVPFAELGGTSLEAGRVCARLAARLDRPVPLSRFYGRSTVTALTKWLREAPDVPRAEEPDIPEGITPLTPMQIVYLTRQLVAPADRTSHCLLTWVIEGELDRAALETAVAEAHDRHEALRVAYVPDPTPSAIAVDIGPPPVEELPAERSTDAAIHALTTELTGELDLASGEVWRTALVPVSGSHTTVFGCVVHHIAFDGWSEGVLARDLSRAYGAASADPAPRRPLSAVTGPLPTPPSLRRLHTDRLRRRAFDDTAAQRVRLVDELTSVPELRWPAAPPGAVAGGGPLRVTARVPASAMAEVDALAARCGVSRFAVLIALWAGGLAKATGQWDFAVGVPTAQRDTPGLEDVVGCHLTMLCLRLRNGALAGGAESVRETGAILTRAFAAQDVPFGEVLTLVDPPRTGRPPLYQVLFALQDNPDPVLELPGLSVTFQRRPYPDLPLELHTECWPESPDGTGGLRVETTFRPGAVTPAVAREVTRHFVDQLDRLDRSASGRALS